MGSQALGEDWEFISIIDTEIEHDANDASTVLEFEHNLGFIPIVWGTAEYSGPLYRMMPVLLVNESGGDEGLVYESLAVFTSPSLIRIVLTTPDITSSRFGSNFTMAIRLYVFRFNADSS